MSRSRRGAASASSAASATSASSAFSSVLASAASAALACALVAAARPAGAQTIPLDSPQTATTWQAMPSEGTEMRLSVEGGALRIDFDFRGHGGYAVAHRSLALSLPQNYEIVFRVRGAAPVENLELKLIDTTGANVWWDNRRDFRFPTDWTTVRTKKRQISFAWGPVGGGELGRLGALELAVTAGSGGHGVVWIDSLRLRPLPPEGPYALTPAASASSSAPGTAAARALDGDRATGWRSAGGGEQWLALDFLQERELGGLRLDWGSPAATAYDVQLSDDGRQWSTAYRVDRGNGGRDYIALPETDTRYLRLLLRRSAGGSAGYELRELRVEPLAFGATRDSFFAAIAREAPRGRYPRAYLGEQTYWTIVGVPGSGREALLDMDGRLEPARGGASIEPFLFAGGRLLGWADGASVPSLAGGDLPIPSVRRSADGLRLTVTAFATSDGSGGPDLWASYRVENPGPAARAATLFLALRPFQVNPPWQFLATQGGVSPIWGIRFEGERASIEGADTLVAFSSPVPTAAGAVPFDAGDVTEYLAGGGITASTAVGDPHELASGALGYRLQLAPGGSAEVCLRIPLERGGAGESGAPAEGECARRQAEAEQSWTGLLDRVGIRIGGAAGGEVERAIRTNLAYVLLNRDGPSLRPGSRSYARSWIRDGALMSEALLRLGHAAEVRDYIRWYAPYQFASGKVPCCVDARGADPVPENDSNGELLFLVAEYFRFTGDTALVREQWPRLTAAAAYIDTLRHQRLTPEYAAGPKQLFHGLLPESISHEGYSAKPMHSYWDDLWAVRGLEDAGFLARVLGLDAEAATLEADAAALRDDVVASMRMSMAQHGIDYLPGAAELGDFDATSTAIALSPLDQAGWLPMPALSATFERYWREFAARRGGTAWENYTPYEWRVVSALARLGWPARADSALTFFMADRRPPAWNEWAEVVWRDPRAPRFIGDMPHTWVAAEFIRSALDLLVVERPDALVVGAGVPAEWLAGNGVALHGLRTRFGSLDLTMRRADDVIRIRVGGDLRLPSGGIVLALPGPLRHTYVNGQEVSPGAGAPVVRTLPAEIEIRD